MNAQMTPQDIDTLARKRVKSQLGWYKHLAVYLLVNAFLIAMSVWQGRHWAIFPLLGWGLAVVLHGASVWFAGAGSHLREGMVERERQKLAAQRDTW
ncbi:MAG: 2TM domain-containing protein [Burkholderiaceae bacterium]|nr:2TM domain-containing protein [Burkholderiaceae bacterium]